MGKFLSDFISLGQTPTVFLCVFFICFVGYAIGAVKIKGINLGTAGVFLFALLFGYLCTLSCLEDIPVLGKFFLGNSADEKTAAEIATKISNYKLISNIGLVLFVTSVGSIAGPKFFRDLKKNAKTYVPMGAIIIIAGALVTVLFALIPGIGSAYASGILSGALTSTPAFSAAKETVKELAGDQEALVVLGQAVAYPFGVIGVVLFVQIMPRLVRADLEQERALITVAAPVTTPKRAKEKKYFALDDFGFAAFGLALVFGVFLGAIKIPLSNRGFNGPCFSLGMTGGPLIMALIIAHYGHIGPISLRVKREALKSFREFGLMLFLCGAGIEGGVVLVDQISKSTLGPLLVVYGFIAGAVITMIPMVVGYIFARKFCKLPLLSSLGSITGGMTSTPALGTLIGVSGTDDVAGAYASTYPIALVLIVLATQLINSIMLG